MTWYPPLSGKSISVDSPYKPDFFGGVPLDPIYYTVLNVNGDYAELVTDAGQPHSITMFLLPEGTTVGSRLKLENFQWELLE